MVEGAERGLGRGGGNRGRGYGMALHVRPFGHRKTLAPCGRAGWHHRRARRRAVLSHFPRGGRHAGESRNPADRRRVPDGAH